jgi:hypothetical protein
MTTGGYISPHSLRTARRGVKICVIPEKEECGAVAGKYKKNPVRRERERERERRLKGGGSMMRICFR